MNRRELANEFTRRYKKEPNKKQPLTRNEAGYKYRLYFIQEDLKNGINPYHSTISPSDVCNLVPQQSSWAEEQFVPSGWPDSEYSLDDAWLQTRH